MSEASKRPEIDRVTRSRGEAQSNYDRLSTWYDFLSGGAEWRYSEESLEMLDPQPGEAVLEIGYGTGKGLEWIRRRTGMTGRLVGVDLSEGMKRVAARRLARARIEDVELVTADALELPFAGDTFDALFMGFTIELFDTPELPAVAAQVRRVLRGAGRAAVCSLSFRRLESRAVRLYRWVHRTFPRAVDCRPIPVRPLFEEAGFEIRELREYQMWGLPVDCLLAAKPID